MRIAKYFLILLLTLICISCGQTRIDLITKNSGLKLPKEYDIIENETKSSGIQDYEINVLLEFDNESFRDIIKQTDSLNKVNKFWSKTAETIEYVNHSNDTESEEIIIDLEKRTLEFNLIHI